MTCAVPNFLRPTKKILSYNEFILLSLKLTDVITRDWLEFRDEILERFEVIIKGIDNMARLIMRMPENLQPMDFYHGMRPYLAGSYNNPGLPNGIVFRGVSSVGKKYAGGSAAQTARVRYFYHK